MRAFFVRNILSRPMWRCSSHQTALRGVTLSRIGHGPPSAADLAASIPFYDTGPCSPTSATANETHRHAPSSKKPRFDPRLFAGHRWATCHQQSEGAPVPLSVFTPVFDRVRVPHRVSLAWGLPARGVATSVKVLGPRFWTERS